MKKYTFVNDKKWNGGYFSSVKEKVGVVKVTQYLEAIKLKIFRYTHRLSYTHCTVLCDVLFMAINVQYNIKRILSLRLLNSIVSVLRLCENWPQTLTPKRCRKMRKSKSQFCYIKSQSSLCIAVGCITCRNEEPWLYCFISLLYLSLLSLLDLSLSPLFPLSLSTVSNAVISVSSLEIVFQLNFNKA